MENFIVSARKYRPDSFDTVIGQSSITHTLKNAIKNNQIAHAYLFCGPRGIGKTTCARILAKTINCSDLKNNTEACNKCESCKSFNESRAFNIHELDAASNNSVEDVRNLIEQIRIPPQIGKYSIYIVDEVHMLSQSAFNAFLKTLEEPPSHAIFILATTEKHKIIPTVLSRCQIYDFNRIKIDDIVRHLEYISKQEKVEYEIDALNIIAHKADGAMRDALSIFDQLISFSEKKITYKGVIESLNVLDFEYYFNLTSAIIYQDVSKCLLIFNEILDNGFDAHNFINGLSSHFRDLLVSKDEQTIKLLEAGNTFRDRYIEQTSQCPPEFIYKALEICNACDVNYKTSKNQRLHVELALIQLCNITGKKKPDLKAEKKEEIEKKKDIRETKEKKETVEIKDIEEKEEIQETGEIEEKKDIRETKEKKETVEIKAEAGEKAEKPPETVHEPRPASTISIKDALKNIDNLSNNISDAGKPESNEPEIPENNEPVPKISLKELKSHWNDYADSIKESMPRMYSTLKSNDPVINERGKIILELDNKAQCDDFNSRIKPELIKHLREKFENGNMEIDVRTGKDSGENDTPYTSDEKFKYMSRKNPLLNKLKQDFNLDFE
jgi:DNA polymerase-3 subunit gamma/tau